LSLPTKLANFDPIAFDPAMFNRLLAQPDIPDMTTTRHSVGSRIRRGSTFCTVESNDNFRFMANAIALRSQSVFRRQDRAPVTE